VDPQVSDPPPRRLIVGLTGSSGPQLGVRLLEVLRDRQDIETHLILSAGSAESLRLEMDRTPDSVAKLADTCYDVHDLAAAVSSGSFVTTGMVIMPCSMRTLGAIAAGITGDLISRAADVCLKERRPLVLVPRETPLNLIHLRNMETLILAGATILPPVPAFYHRPATITDLVDHIVGKVLDQLGIEHDLFRRWR
jgi:polyprenyl P-hydroxybenzoate/phenylacrylic acid decarboxylase-like protein